MAVTQTDSSLGGPMILAAAGDKIDRNIFIREAVWAGCSAAAHALKIVDYDSGTILYEGLGVANQDSQLWGLNGQRLRNGIKVTNLGSGRVLLYT